MSEYQTPIGPIFELQREAIKRSADLLQLPRSIRGELFEEGLAAGERAGTQLLELSRQSAKRSLAVAESVRQDDGLDGLDEAVDELFDNLQDRHEQVYDTVGERYERTEMAAQTRGAEQLTILLEFNRRLERQLGTALGELQARASRSDDVATELTDQIERLSEQLDR